jgi:hypothetical protein
VIPKSTGQELSPRELYYRLKNPYPGHGNRDDNWNPHSVYEFSFTPLDTHTPIIKYGIYDQIKNPKRALNQLKQFQKEFGPTVKLKILSRNLTRAQAKFIEQALVTNHVINWGDYPRRQKLPGIFGFE